MRFTCVRADVNLKDVTIGSATGDYNPEVQFVSCIDSTRQIWCAIPPLMRLRFPNHVAQIIASPPSYFASAFPMSGSSRAFRDAGIINQHVHSKTPAAERWLGSSGQGISNSCDLRFIASASPSHVQIWFLERIGDPNGERRFLKHRLCRCCPINAVSEFYGSDRSFVSFTSAQPRLTPLVDWIRDKTVA